MNRILTLSGAGFEAARSLAASTAPHTQGLHGHSFRLSVRHPHLALATLREAVHTAVAPFDYRHLNQALANPDNATLIAALADRLPERSVLIRSDGFEQAQADHRRGDARGEACVWMHRAVAELGDLQVGLA